MRGLGVSFVGFLFEVCEVCDTVWFPFYFPRGADVRPGAEAPRGRSYSENTSAGSSLRVAICLAPSSASSLYFTPVCDLTLLMCVLKPRSSLVLIRALAAAAICGGGWCNWQG